MKTAKIIPALALMLLAFSTWAKAELSTVCKKEGRTRTVAITTESPTSKVPCKVDYKKVDEEPGVTQTLWTAQYQPEYCVEKAERFVEQLKASGWQCSNEN
jgi:hypothetical protein